MRHLFRYPSIDIIMKSKCQTVTCWLPIYLFCVHQTDRPWKSSKISSLVMQSKSVWNMRTWFRATWIKWRRRASDVGITGSDSKKKKKDAFFCEEEESILRDDSPPNLQGLTFDMKSYCAGVLSPKFIHQLFTVDGDRISVGNYKGWVFSLRQKECDTAIHPG